MQERRGRCPRDVGLPAAGSARAGRFAGWVSKVMMS